MELHQFIKLIRLKRKTIFGVIALFILVAGVVVAFQRFKYSSESQLLVVQERQGAVVDAYTASKSSEQLSRVLASVVTSNSFYNKVTAGSPSINVAYFGASPKEQMKQWRKTVTARNLNDTGIIAISIYHPDRTEAEKIAGAVNYVLMTQHSAYDGAGESVKVRLINQPITSNLPVKPNLPLIFGLALALGLTSGLIYVYLLAESSVSQNQVSQPERFAETPAFQRRYPVELASKLSNYRPPVTQQPVYQEKQPLTPYGNHDTVNLNNMPSRISDENFDPEVIVRQGDMRNIL
jgi:uncharacterized protein involved in exopolysaccharide biosynthesis